MHKKAKTFPLYSKSRIRYFRFIAKHKNSREEDKTFPLRKRSLVMVMRIMIKIITILVMIYTIIMKNLREEDKNISSLWGKGVWCRQRATKASVPFNNGSNQ